MSTYLGDYPPKGYSMGAWKPLALTYSAAFTADVSNPPMYRRSESGRVQIKGTIVRTPAAPVGPDLIEAVASIDTVAAHSVLAHYLHWGNINADASSRGILVNMNQMQAYIRNGTDRVTFAAEYMGTAITAAGLPDIG